MFGFGWRQVGSVVGAVGLVAGMLMAAVALAPAMAGAKSEASGTITCSAVTGTVTYKPGVHENTLPKTHHGVSKITYTLDLAKSGCVVGGDSNPVGDIGSFTAKSTISGKFACLSFAEPVSLTSSWTVKWGGTLTSSVVGFPEIQIIKSGNEDPITFVFPGPMTGKAIVNGSYPGADAGASSTLVLDTSQTASQIQTSCSSSTGLTSLTVASGSFFVG
jgi:hypothetical protein